MRYLASRTLPAIAVLLTALPVHWVLLASEPGSEALAAVARADRTWLLGWFSTAIIVVASLFFSRLGAPSPWSVSRLHDWFVSISGTWYQVTVAALAFFVALGVRCFVLGGEPLLIDTHSQLVHARYLATGKLSAPATTFGASWQPPLGVVTERGWTSQYPPGQLLLLATALRIGVLPLLGACLHAAAVWLCARLAEYGQAWRTPLRLAALAYALSPMALIHAAGLLSSTTTALLVLIGAYAAVRSDGRYRWPLLAGLVVGLVLLTRPLSALTLALPTVLFVLVSRGRRPRAMEWAMGFVGALPALLALAGWNWHQYGSPLLLGYTAAQGAAHNLGFHTNPWGFEYGPLQALGYTSLDLITLSRHLFEIGVPVVPALGLVYLNKRPIARFEVGVWGLALLPVAGLFFFWHHPDVPGPRLLGESLPIWCLLSVLAMARFLKQGGRMRLTFMALSILAASVLAPLRMSEYHTQVREWAQHREYSIQESAVIFVHGPWLERVAMRLAAAGTPANVVQAATRHNSTCLVELAASELEAGQTPPVLAIKPVAPMPVVRRSGRLAEIRVTPEEPFPQVCAINKAADKWATLPATFSLWRYDLPHLRPRAGIAVVRDLGPDLNERVLAAWPDRTPYLAFLDENGVTHLLPYTEGIRRVWASVHEDTTSHH